MTKAFLPLLLSLALLGGCGAGGQDATPASSGPAASAPGGVDCGTVEFPNGQEAPDGSAYFTAFWELSAAGRPARVQLIRYTVEGDPITYALSFDGASYTCTEDATADRFGAQEVQTTVWPYLFPVDTMENGALYRTWELSDAPYEGYLEAVYETGGADGVLTLFRERIEPQQVLLVECGALGRADSASGFPARDAFVNAAYAQGLPAHIRILPEDGAAPFDVTFDGQTYTVTGADGQAAQSWDFLVYQDEEAGTRSFWLSGAADSTENGLFLFRETAPIPAQE